jgi:predicted NBD/HSP70 family sugar kinase
MSHLCIDCGGTKTLVCIVDDNGTITHRIKFPTPDDYPAFLDQLADTVHNLPEQDFSTCVMAIPGLINKQTGTVIAFGNRPWANVTIVSDVSARLGLAPLVENDAKLAGLAEARQVQHLYRRVLYITVSTGIGSALLINGEISTDMATTEFGKMPLPFDGKIVDWEDFASGRALTGTLGKRAEAITDPAEWQEVARRLSFGLGPVCAAFQPEAIIFGGGVGQYADNFIPYLTDYLQKTLHPVIVQPKALLPCSNKEDSVIYGCFELTKQQTPLSVA